MTNIVGAGVATNLALGSGSEANLGAVSVKGGSAAGVTNIAGGGLATNLALGSGSTANSGSVMVRGGGVGGGITNVSGIGLTINDKDYDLFSFGQNTNIAFGGRTSNKNSVVVK